ncbi:allantoate amidohydrolase [Salmonella enterica subsp. enterica]|uniref:Allantoate amidohydrolase n=1 Tax=Salmonella enterica I TaxID=59201 RepID=A0A447MWN9_SALET|nr:allantoate amidohydrolase [Salmonella enterica subsp. enterica]
MIKHFRHAIEETLPWLSSIGADPTGGMTRLLYSPEWLETQQQFKKRMAEAVWKHALMTSEIYMAAFAAHNFRSR